MKTETILKSISEIKLSIDFIQLTGERRLINKFIDATIDRSDDKIVKYDTKEKRGFKYAWVDFYNYIPDKSNIYNILLLLPQDNKFPYLLKIEHPDQSCIGAFEGLFEGYNYSVSKVELSFDIYSDNNRKVYSFLKHKIFLKNRGEALNLKYDETVYYNNIRKANSKGVKMYIKDNGFVRVEITLKRNALLGNNIRALPDFLTIDPIIFEKYFNFMQLNKKRLGRRLKKSGVEYEPIFKKIINADYKKLKNDLADEIKGYVGCHCLKKDPFHESFVDAVSGRSFFEV